MSQLIDSCSTLNRVRELLSYDAESGVFTWKPRALSEFSCARLGSTWNTRYAGKEAGKTSSGGYIQIWIDGKQQAAHRLAWLISYECWPAGDIDHVNGVRRDNRIANLRDVTRSENLKNAAIPKTNTSGVMGVSWMSHIGRWQAYIQVDGCRSTLGYYTDFDEAVAVRKAAESRYGYHQNHGRKASEVGNG